MVQKQAIYSNTSVYNGRHKVNSASDNSIFVPTQSYEHTKKTFEKLKKSRGNMVHVVGAPGTGKSANIFHAINETELEVYEISTSLSDLHAHSHDVFCALVKDLKDTLQCENKEQAYEKLSQYDVVLFADQFHDKHLFDENTVGFSLWTRHAGFKSVNFYFICIREYLKFHKYFKKMNIVFQTAWRVRWRGKKYDLFTDFGILSRFILKILDKLFCVVEISYSTSETINIVKTHFKNIDEKKLKDCIKKYGCRPRFILEELENKE